MTQVDGVPNSNNAGWNRQLANQLDEMDGKKDGKISASVWNAYIGKMGSSGNKVKNYITVDNAARSLGFYKQTKDAGEVDWENNWQTKSDELAKDLSETAIPPESELTEPTPTANSSTTKKSELPPPSDLNETPITSTKNDNNDDTEVSVGYNPDGNGNVYIECDDDGFKTEKFYNGNGGITKENHYAPNGKLSGCYEYDSNGNEKKYISYNADGSEWFSIDTEYDSDGNKTKRVDRNSEGDVVMDSEYDTNGNIIKITHYNADGSVKEFYDVEHDDNGNETRVVKRSADGSEEFSIDVEYDDNGNETMVINKP